MKTCTKCKQNKEYTHFNKKQKSPDGYAPRCKACKKEEDGSYYQQNKSSILQRSNEYYKDNKEIIAERNKENAEQRNEYNKQWKQDNKEYVKEYNKDYRQNNNEQIKEYRKEYKKENREQINQYEKERLKNNPIAKLAKRMRNRFNELIRNNGWLKESSLTEYLGCSLLEFKQYIESLFQEGMSWENYGAWHIDHSISLISASNIETAYKLNHYLNLKPMWAKPNIQKNDYNDKCWQKLIREQTIGEDLKRGLPFEPDISTFILSEEKLTSEHRDFIEKYEWLGKIGFGVRYVFTARHNGILGGVVMIAEPNNYQFDKKLESLIQRGACAGWTPKNLGSKLVMFACNWMVRNTSKRIFVAYSDSTAGEIGTIYQACNFDYLGSKYGSSYLFILPCGKKVNSRYFTRTSSIKKWAKILGIKWLPEWTKTNGFQDIKAMPKEIKKQLNEYAKNEMKKYTKIKVKPKGKYVLLLNYGKNKVQKTWVPVAYPKRKVYN